MKTRSAICYIPLVWFLVPLCARADTTEVVFAAERPRMALYAEEVMIEGKARPDLARALTDSLSTSLVKRGQVRLFSLESAAGQDAAGILAAGNPGTTAQRLKRLLDEGLDYILTFSVVGIDGRQLLSVKKTRARSSEVVEAHQYTHLGHEAGLFKFIPEIISSVDPLPYGKPGSFPRSQSPAEYQISPQPQSPPIVIAKALPAGPSVISAESPDYDPWKQNLAPGPDLRQVPKALVYRELGTVNHIDKTWRFCIIDPVHGTRFREQDPLHILWDEGDVYAALRVSTVERGGVVLDLGRTPDHHPIFKGDKVYGWAPPLAR